MAAWIGSAADQALSPTLLLARRGRHEGRADGAYKAQPHVVRPAEGWPHVPAAATLRDVVMSCLELAQATGEFEMPSSGVIPVILCPDATPLWRTSATRCAV